MSSVHSSPAAMRMSGLPLGSRQGQGPWFSVINSSLWAVILRRLSRSSTLPPWCASETHNLSFLSIARSVPQTTMSKFQLPYLAFIVNFLLQITGAPPPSLPPRRSSQPDALYEQPAAAAIRVNGSAPSVRARPGGESAYAEPVRAPGYEQPARRGAFPAQSADSSHNRIKTSIVIFVGLPSSFSFFVCRYFLPHLLVTLLQAKPSTKPFPVSCCHWLL